MKKLDLSHRIAHTTGIRADVVQTILDEAMLEIKKAVNRGEPVYLRTFGTFLRHTTPAKIGRNLQANTPLPIPPRYTTKFIVAKTWQAELKKITINK